MTLRPLARALFALVLAAAWCLPARAQSLLVLDSDPGDFVGWGQYLSFTHLDGSFRASTTFGGAIRIEFNNPDHFWHLSFAPIGGETLGPGAYTHAERFPFQSPTAPGLDVSGDGRGCNRLSGRFVVLELEISATGGVTKLAADFEQHCEDVQPALFGSIRINSTLPVVPRLAVGSTRVLEGDVGLSDTAFEVFLTRRLAVPVTADFTTVPGTAQSGTDYLPASGALVLAPGELDSTIPVLVRANTTSEPDRSFGLELSNVAGATVASASGSAVIQDDDDGKTVLYLDSTFGDYIGQGVRQSFGLLEGRFSGVLSGNVASIYFRGADTWSLDFAAPNGSPLVPGTYEGARRHTTGGAFPGLAVSGAGRGCNQLSGRFVIHEIVMGTGTSLVRFAADFEQHCENGSSALFGSIRLNSSVPIVQQTPVVGDMNSDGATDVVWRHQTLGFDVAELLDGIEPMGFANLPRLADPSWEIVATNDWSGDGNTDLYWRNRVTGRNFILFLVGGTPSGYALLPTIADTHWQVVAAGRFTSDVWADVLWRNDQTGENTVAVMNGATVASSFSIPPEPDLDWVVVGVADFNRTGIVEIVWHNRATGATRLWFAPGVPSPLPDAPPSHDGFGLGDYNRDGVADILWRHAVNGQQLVWFMRDSKRLGLALPTPFTDLDWKIVGPK